MKIFKNLFIFLIALILAMSLAYAMTTVTPNSIAKNSPNNANSYFAKVNGIRLHYIEMGKGPLVILLHGWPETSSAWSKTMMALSGKYRVVAPDLRGLGLSEHTSSGYDKKTIATDLS